jgi:hypothetical protein
MKNSFLLVSLITATFTSLSQEYKLGWGEDPFLADLSYYRCEFTEDTAYFYIDANMKPGLGKIQYNIRVDKKGNVMGTPEYDPKGSTLATAEYIDIGRRVSKQSKFSSDLEPIRTKIAMVYFITTKLEN